MKLLCILFLSCAMTVSNTEAQNKLTPAEEKAGWKLLFDGKTTRGWHVFNNESDGSAWKVEDGALALDPSSDEGRGDLVTADEYEHYELALEWRISPNGNSGILFNVVEDPKYKEVWQTGPEMQVLDNDGHKDGKIITHRAGDLYDLIKCSKETVKPVGEWNQVRLVSNKSNYEFWLNGTKVVTFTMHDETWNKMIADSKFKDMPDFGRATKGHIALQDHNDKVWFRNIKIRELK